MKDFLQEKTLYRATPLAAAVTLMAVPRLHNSPLEEGLLFLTAFAFAAMMLAAGAAFAWEHKGGLPGVFPPGRRRLAQGIAAGILLAAFLAVFFYSWYDPLLQDALRATGQTELIESSFPREPGFIFSVMLWSMGFHTLFLTAAPMAVLARVTHSVTAAILLTVAGRVAVSLYRIGEYDLQPIFALGVLSTVLVAGSACLLYARFGLAAPMAFSASLSLRHFFS